MSQGTVSVTASGSILCAVFLTVPLWFTSEISSEGLLVYYKFQLKSVDFLPHLD